MVLSGMKHVAKKHSFEDMDLLNLIRNAINIQKALCLMKYMFIALLCCKHI